MWDDRVYKKALKFIRFSFLGLICLWTGAGFHSIPLVVAGVVCGLALFFTGAFLIARMAWTEGEKDENL